MYKHVRQGDLLIRQCDPNRVEEDAKEVEGGVVEVGEGHHIHRLNPDDVNQGNAKVLDEATRTPMSEPRRIIEVTKPSRLEHTTMDGSPSSDHGPIDLEPGTYEVLNQRERDLRDRRTGSMRRVMD